MSSIIAKLCLAGVLAAGLGACASHKGHDHGAHSGEHMCEACAAGKSGESTWCEKCDVGFVEGEKVKCAGCYAAKTGGPECEACSSK